MGIRKILTIAMFLAIIVISQMLLVGLPNIQLTTMLFVLFFSFNKPRESVILIGAYTIMMGVFWGYTVWLLPMFVAWAIALIIFEIKFTTNEYHLAAKSVLMAITLGVTYGLFSWLMFGWPLAGFLSYMAVDIVFELLMAASNIVTILWIYPRMYDILILLGETPR